MVNRNAPPTNYFWNCLGSALFVASIGLSISVARTETLELELARYKLKTGSALNKVQQVSEELEQASESLPIGIHEKQEIKQKIRDADRVLVEAENQIEQSAFQKEASF